MVKEMNKNDWYDKQVEEAKREFIEKKENKMKRQLTAWPDRFATNHVNKLTMCLKDIAERYGLGFDSYYDYCRDELYVGYSDGDKRRSFSYKKALNYDIEPALNDTEQSLIVTFDLDRKKKTKALIPAIKNVIFNDPATIVFWEDGTKTVVKAQDEEFDPEKGLAMAISKKALGNQGNYCNEFKKWIPEEEE